MDDVLCSDGRPIIALLLGEVQDMSFFNEIGQPLKFVRMSVKPMYHADVVMGHRIIKQLAANVKKGESDLFLSRYCADSHRRGRAAD